VTRLSVCLYGCVARVALKNRLQIDLLAATLWGKQLLRLFEATSSCLLPVSACNRA
jgi:hypothetical protein